MQKRTFAILKPNGNFYAHGMILDQLEAAGFKVVHKETRTLDMEVLREHYAHHADKPFFRPMVDYLVSGPSVLLILEREDDEDPVKFLREMVGPTDPKKGESEQIRYDFGTHHETCIFKNAIHASDAGEVEAEIKRFFPNHTWFVLVLKNTSVTKWIRTKKSPSIQTEGDLKRLLKLHLPLKEEILFFS